MEIGLVVREVLDPPAGDVIGDTDLERLEAIENVELRERNLRQGIDANCVPHHHRIEPAGTAPSASVGAVLAANGHKMIADVVEQFGRERAGPDPGDVRLGDADDPLDVAGTDARSRTRTPCDRIGRRDEGIRAMVEVEE